MLLQREPHEQSASRLLSRCEIGEASGFLCATAVTNIVYLLRRHLNRLRARTALAALIGILDVAPVNRSVIENALASEFRDLEDAVAYFSGRLVSIDAVVTRNIRDFSPAEVPIYAPAEVLTLLDQRR